MSIAPRPPVVAVMGHIDHGKSSLLDAIRKTNVVATEAGGITQHVSAYEVAHTTAEGAERRITFLDTPGHEAFKTMRASGATIADIAILVLAADEGVKPQTLEARQAIVDAGIPYVVAITKVDKPGADVTRAQTSLLENEIYLEGLGGDIPYASVSAKTKEGIPELLELILLTAELHEIRGDADQPAVGAVLESSRDPKSGNGATLVIKDGTLTVGATVVAGGSWAPVRFIEAFDGARITSAGPGRPVRVLGFSTLPSAGTPFSIVASKKEAEAAVLAYATSAKAASSAREEASGRAILPLVVKADVSGTLDAVMHELAKLSHEHIEIKVVGSGVGAVSEADVKLAATSLGGAIVGMGVKVEGTAHDLAERQGTSVATFRIIYELSEHVAQLLAERAPKVEVEEQLARIKVLRSFNRAGSRLVFGGRVEEGTLTVGSLVKILRRDIEIGRGKLTNLQLQRADVQSVPPDTEFGGQIESRFDAAPGDQIVAYRMTTT